jgi:two-component system, cell cycle response regulator DivK
MDRQHLILLVDDDENNRFVYAALLGHYGYAVQVAGNGAEGVEEAERHRPDLILMDLTMPVMDGWEALRHVRANAELAHTPVIAVTAHDIEEERWRSAGFSAYLRKPCLPTRVLDSIRECLSERADG